MPLRGYVTPVTRVHIIMDCRPFGKKWAWSKEGYAIRLDDLMELFPSNTLSVEVDLSRRRRTTRVANGLLDNILRNGIPSVPATALSLKDVAKAVMNRHVDKSSILDKALQLSPFSLHAKYYALTYSLIGPEINPLFPIEAHVHRWFGKD